jgi:hypothetical protein
MDNILENIGLPSSSMAIEYQEQLSKFFHHFHEMDPLANSRKIQCDCANVTDRDQVPCDIPGVYSKTYNVIYIPAIIQKIN